MAKDNRHLQRKELKKHVAIIHCANTFSLLQRKLSNALLYHAYSHLLEKEEHEISIRQLCNIIDYSGNNYTVIKQALKQLIATVIEWNVIDETGEEDWSASSILASVRLKGATCYYAYSKRLSQLLANPTMYAKINLAIQARFTSSYGLALYENCIRFRRLPHTKTFDIESFRKIMGVPNNKYEIFRDLKRRVIDKAVEEVNRLSELQVEPEYTKSNRQVVSIRFKLHEKHDFDQPVHVNREEEERGEGLSTVELLVKSYGFSKKSATQLCQNYTDEMIQDKLSIIQNSQSFKMGKIRNVPSYLVSALQEDYQTVSNVVVKTIKPVIRKKLSQEIKVGHENLVVELEKQRQTLVMESLKNISSEEKIIIYNKIRSIDEKINNLDCELACEA